MSVLDDLKRFDLKAWLILISILLLIVALFLPIHVSYKLTTIENEKDTITAYTYIIKHEHSISGHVEYQESIHYAEIDDKFGYTSYYMSYLDYLFPILIIVSVLFFLYELVRAEIVGRKGIFLIIGIVILLFDIALFTNLWNGFMIHRYGLGFHDESQGFITILYSKPELGYWMIITSIVILIIAFLYGQRKETVSLLT